MRAQPQKWPYMFIAELCRFQCQKNNIANKPSGLKFIQSIIQVFEKKFLHQNQDLPVCPTELHVDAQETFSLFFDFVMWVDVY